MGSVLYSINMIYYINGFFNVKTTFHSWDKFHLVRVYHFFIRYWIQVANILLRIFAQILFCSFLMISGILLCWGTQRSPPSSMIH